ncbi:YcbK family protein [Bacteroides heparinolyticus]|uniref:YcbK family protein n=1 Tax=Prevotella heparinolytica TaxID=28113 RepID=UPI0035A1CE1B
MAITTYSLATDGNTYLSTNFKVKEFKCNDGSDTILIDSDLVTYLQKIRNWAGKAVTINSGYRTASYNQSIGGATNSYHVKGQAADIVVSGKTPLEVARKAEELGMKGIIKYGSFVHVDTRTTKYFSKDGGATSCTTFN